MSFMRQQVLVHQTNHAADMECVSKAMGLIASGDTVAALRLLTQLHDNWAMEAKPQLRDFDPRNQTLTGLQP
jgi:hypothetical protein